MATVTPTMMSQSIPWTTKIPNATGIDRKKKEQNFQTEAMLPALFYNDFATPMHFCF